ncbi:MAG: sigma-54 interaction domain-containing protein, partial [Myxococcota bacterium]
ASDVLEKPLHGAEVLLTVRRAREFVRLQRQAKLVRRDVERATSDPPIVASSEAMIELLEVMERAAPFKSSILLYGERGTGKEVLARAIHAQSPRRHLPFVAVNCCAIPKAVLRSELFGHHGDTDPNADPTRRGLFAEANEGTLFLDGIGELPIPIQAEILRVLQDEEIRPVGGSKPRPIDIRLIAATSRDLAPEVAAGRFREDLLHRLNLVRLDVPPLRERPRDIPLLFDHFLVHYSEVLGKPTHGIADDALAQLVRYRWPGNIRELANVVERAVILSTGDRIAIRDLPDDLGLPPQAPDAALPERGFGLKAARKSLEADLIRRALRATSGNRTHAARRLEISHRGLLYKIKEYGIRD